MLKGISLSAGIFVVSYGLNYLYPTVSPIVIALALGIVTANTLKLGNTFQTGIDFSSKKILEWAIVFMGFGISLNEIGNIGTPILILIITTIVTFLILSILLHKMFNIKGSSGYLMAFGTAICGTSAIAALAPKLKSSKTELGISIAVINLLGFIGMVAAPWLLNSFDDLKTALFIGGSLHGVGNVAGGGYAISANVGDLALTIKLVRVAFLAPALIFYTLLLNTEGDWRKSLKLPYYLIGFILTSTFVTLFELPNESLDSLRFIGNMLLTIAMAAIGLKIQFNELYSEGKKALKMGSLLFFLLIGILFGFTYLIV